MKLESCKNYTEKDDLMIKIAVVVRQRGVNILKIKMMLLIVLLKNI